MTGEWGEGCAGRSIYVLDRRGGQNEPDKAGGLPGEKACEQRVRGCRLERSGETENVTGRQGTETGDSGIGWSGPRCPAPYPGNVWNSCPREPHHDTFMLLASRNRPM